MKNFLEIYGIEWQTGFQSLMATDVIFSPLLQKIKNKSLYL